MSNSEYELRMQQNADFINSMFTKRQLEIFAEYEVCCRTLYDFAKDKESGLTFEEIMHDLLEE